MLAGERILGFIRTNRCRNSSRIALKTICPRPMLPITWRCATGRFRPRERNRKFESTSLQRRVRCEPDRATCNFIFVDDEAVAIDRRRAHLHGGRARRGVLVVPPPGYQHRYGYTGDQYQSVEALFVQLIVSGWRWLRTLFDHDAITTIAVAATAIFTGTLWRATNRLWLTSHIASSQPQWMGRWTFISN
jgi:hypothetical protein